MIAKGLLQAVDADMRKGVPMWRENGDGHSTTLVATEAGLAAIGFEPEEASDAPTGATDARTEELAPDTPAEPDTAPNARTMRNSPAIKPVPGRPIAPAQNCSTGTASLPGS